MALLTTFLKKPWYITVKSYLRLVHETLMVRRRYTIGLENLPKEGEKFIIACNHQNTANDPLNIVFTIPLYLHVCALARADVFNVHPLFTRFLHWIGLTPAFRLGWEGVDGIEHNFSSFDMIADRVLEGNPTIVFPEAGHTQGHYVAPFTTGIVRMGFYAAKKTGWQEDIKIVPTAHHYDDYFKVRQDFIWRIGEPISLKPYYDAFQEHPNAVLRDVKRLLFKSVQAMMLDEGLDDYVAKDFLRNSEMNMKRTPDAELPTQLEQDKLFISELMKSDYYTQIIKLADTLRIDEERIGVTEDVFRFMDNKFAMSLRLFAVVCLFPLWIVSLWPHALLYKLPTFMLKTDVMFTNSYRYIVSVLFLLPLCTLITLIAGILCDFFWESIVWIALWLPLGCFSWWYYEQIGRLTQCMRYIAHRREMNNLRNMRKQIMSMLSR